MDRRYLVPVIAVVLLVALALLGYWLVQGRGKRSSGAAYLSPEGREHDLVLEDGLKSSLRGKGRELAEAILAGYSERADYPPLVIDWPVDGSLFPSDMACPLFQWRESSGQCDLWLVRLQFQGGGSRIHVLTQAPRWVPERALWETIKELSLEKPAVVTIVGVSASRPNTILSKQQVSICTSHDPVGAAVFFRDVPLPTQEALRAMDTIRWRLGSVASNEPPAVVLKNLPVCGNCHSFSADGRLMGMDVDYAGDKGAYAIMPVSKEMRLSRDRVISWGDYRREDGEGTFGLLSQISPDGRHVASTVKDQSLFVPMPDLYFSQLFFPAKGILGVYDVEARTFAALPGADDPHLVQSNPSWSPDGKYIVFARAPVQEAVVAETSKTSAVLYSEDPLKYLGEKYQIRYDLYRVPFNEGRGGKAEPLAGASSNGMSNFFARYSPDGKWIIFTRSKRAMLLQPDSELYIVPADGGRERRLSCNTSRMNSWHSWSPNSRWLIFSSKVNTAYTQLFLTHIDEQGRDSPAIFLWWLTAPDRAANIPEFVNVAPDAIARITERLGDDYSYYKLALIAFDIEDYAGPGADLPVRAKQDDKAEQELLAALKADPNNADAHCDLAACYAAKGDYDRAKQELRSALKLRPDDLAACLSLGMLLAKSDTPEAILEAISLFLKAAELDPTNSMPHGYLGNLYFRSGKLDLAVKQYQEALALKPQEHVLQFNLGAAYARLQQDGEAEQEFRAVLEADARNAQACFNLGVLLSRRPTSALDAIAFMERGLALSPGNVGAHLHLAELYRSLGRTEPALAEYQKALELSPGNPSIQAKIQQLRPAPGQP